MALTQLGARYAAALNVNIDDVMRCLDSLQTTHLQLASNASDHTPTPASHNTRCILSSDDDV